MSIIDENQPRQPVRCDLCLTEFSRPLSKRDSIMEGLWERVSIYFNPYLYEEGKEAGFFNSSGSITIQHACEDCRKTVTRRFAEIIGSMKKD